MTKMFSFMMHRVHGSKLSPSLKITKQVILKAKVSKSVYPLL